MAAENRPPRRFNIIETHIRSKDYNTKTRKINRAYLKRYTRKRNAVVASLSKLVGARQARAKALLEALNAARFTVGIKS